jgi:hypothetical protein
MVPAENKITFSGLRWPAKIAQFSVAITFSGYWKQFSAVISIDAAENMKTAKNSSALFSAATLRPPKILQT